MRSTFRLAAFAAAALLSTVAAGAQTVDELVAKNIAAKGGVDLIRQTTSVKMTGTFTQYPPPWVQAGQPMEMAMTTWAKRPNLVRQEATMTLPAQRGQAGPPAPIKSVRASDGSTVWMQVGSNPPQKLPTTQAEPMMQQAEFDSVFYDYQARGITLALVGRETLNGRSVFHLKVSRTSGPVQHYYLDAETGLEAKVSTQVSQGGATSSVDTEIGDFRLVEGRMVPFRQRQLVNGQLSGEMAIETVEFNVPMPDSLFRMPLK